MSSKILKTITFLLCTLLVLPARGQDRLTEYFQERSDTLSLLVKQKTTVTGRLKIRKVVPGRRRSLDFHFTESLGDIPWNAESRSWFRQTLKALLPAEYAGYHIGDIFCRKTNLEDLLLPDLRADGQPQKNARTVNDPAGSSVPLVTEIGGMQFDKGLSGRHIALWQSHGKYYEAEFDRWEWQRAPDFTTVEDTYTQSYVLPFLIPMLENAGAYVMTPRERDIQRNEVICDNDPAFEGPREEGVRGKGDYTERGGWSAAGVGFADARKAYAGLDNPFAMGTARQAKCRKKGADAVAVWTPDIPEKGEYAVYVSYKSLKNSTRSAHYTVTHAGGTTEFSVNQRMGGGTWIYLGTFSFEKGRSGGVRLDNGTPEGRKYVRGSAVTADAVKIGGGMGKIARGRDGASPLACTTSGVPSYLEGALYWMQWAGADSTVTRQFENDYTNDYGGRGAWVNWMSGGSAVNPKAEGKGIPFDLSFAFHTDAGTTPDDSIIGTLSIYTLLSDQKSTLPDGESRLACRDLAGMVQDQIVADVRRQFNPDWSRRFLWDRSYSESRTPPVPAMLLELLSHQNFGDMKFGLDPSFRFTVSRAIYKGMLKYLSTRYGCEYVVQPLPVRSFAVTLEEDGGAVLSWKATKDSLEATAVPDGYILYRKEGDGAFDGGTRIVPERHGETFSCTVPLQPGRISSFRIAACNAGGRSFPSETLCAGRPEEPVSDKKVWIVNNFTRVSGPAWFDTPEYAGFLTGTDRGVAWGREIHFIGESYQYRRSQPWLDDDNPGFGGSYINEAGRQYAGNTFDYPYLHGKALMAAGHAFCSASAEAFEEEAGLAENAWAIDLICGKQITVTTGCGKVPDRFRIFPEKLQSALTAFTAGGGNVLISGAYIGTDAWDRLWPVRTDSAAAAGTRKFIEQVLGYRWMTCYGGRSGEVRAVACPVLHWEGDGTIAFHTAPNETMYNVENPDGLVPATDRAATFLRYTDSGISAGVCFDGGGYRTVSLGFPIETLKREEDLRNLMRTVLGYFDGGTEEEGGPEL